MNKKQNVLVVCEKPSVAKEVASALGANNRVVGAFDGNGYVVTWCFGHLAGLAEPERYDSSYEKYKWEDLPIIPKTWKLLPVSEKSAKEQYNRVVDFLCDSGISEVICATDADREGECIFRFIYILSKSKKPVKRLWVSSLEREAIMDGMAKLKPMSEYNNLFNAGFNRAKADWLIGMNGSRVMSLHYKQAYAVGRVMTPTLAMIVERDREILNFKSSVDYTVDITCTGKDGKSFIAESVERFKEMSDANKVRDAVEGKTAKVSGVKSTDGTLNPPTLFDLTSLQKAANRKWGYSAQVCLDTVQELYEKKLCSYPRTDSKYISTDMKSTADGLAKIVIDKFCGGKIKTKVNIDQTIKDSKVVGHPALLPQHALATVDMSSLSTKEQNILKLISQRLLEATGTPCKYTTTDVTLDCQKHEFTARGKHIVDKGWKAFSSISGADKEEVAEKELPALDKEYPDVESATKRHETEPPQHYTEATILAAMEKAGGSDYDKDIDKKGLGTPATRAATIEKLLMKKYIVRNGKTILATPLGVSLIDKAPAELKSVATTVEWETALQRMSRTGSDVDTFLPGIEDYLRDLTKKEYAAEMANPVPKAYGHSAGIGFCPHCHADVIKGKFGFYCSAKCGMMIASYFGKSLTDYQVKLLLSGKRAKVTSGTYGERYLVPSCVESHWTDKNGEARISYQWKAEKG